LKQRPASKKDDRSAPAKRSARADQIADQILELITAGELQPGDRLREQDLADRFSVSRNPVREALRQLASQSVIQIEPMRGATITRLSDREALDMIAASAALFGVGCRLAAERATEADLEALAHEIEKLAVLAEAGGPPKSFFLQTLVAGRTVMNAHKNERLRGMIRSARFGAPTYFGPLGFANEELRRAALHKWTLMHSALAARNGEEAERLGRELHNDALGAALASIT
jgi:DNA-binding GntR family transcriptional regulator